MKHRLITLIIALIAAYNMTAQTVISGVVTDGRQPLAGANVFILGTIDGCLADSLGAFSFTSSKTGEVTLKASYIGYEDWMLTADVNQLGHVTVVMKERATTINEVVITASSFSFGKSDNFKTLDALDVVLTGNSCGDVVAALQSLPGTQKVGEDGKLYVRGGESDECQTFVNGMHVLIPYTTNTENSAVRGRFSPFLFKGINFSLGGYGGEYGQALSSVLPMETTDVATGDKLGVSASLVDWNVGGTKAFSNSSLSFNGALTSMGLYERLSPGRFDFTSPYRKGSGEAQYKRELGTSGVIKSYVGYDLTSVGQHIDGRDLSLTEHNFYANVTHQASIAGGLSLFTGIAYSAVCNDIDQARIAGDHYHCLRQEVHLKAEARKAWSGVLKMSAGMEDYIRSSSLKYEPAQYQLDYHILAAHADAQWRVVPKLFLNLSTRAEMMRGTWLLMPRATLSYVPSPRWQCSFVAGRYSQAVADDYLAQSRQTMTQSTTGHFILSMQYKTAATLLRIEPYWKKYHHLPLMENGLFVPNGYGYSRGVDVFVENHTMVRNLTTTLSYSYNDSERLYLDFDHPRMPEYVSRHNLRLNAKYAIGKTIVGVSESWASARYFTNGKTPHYNSVDVSVTYLLSPKVIVYTSLSNVLGRNNIFRYDSHSNPVMAARDRFLYIGLFISLKNNKAYDISNF